MSTDRRSKMATVMSQPAKEADLKREMIESLTTTFEAHAQITETGVEYWLARDLQHLLGYSEWRNFTMVLNKAKTACEISDHPVADHFVDVNKMVGDGVVADLAGRLRLVEDHGEVAPLRVAEQVLEISGKPVFDSGLGDLGMGFESGRQGLDHLALQIGLLCRLGHHGGHLGSAIRRHGGSSIPAVSPDVDVMIAPSLATGPLC